MSKPQESHAPSGSKPSSLQIALAFTAFVGAFGLLLFLPAGRSDWTAAWLYLAIVTAGIAINYLYLRSRNPKLIRHRMRIGKGTKTWDKLWMVVFTPLFVAVYVIAGLDAGRFGWSTMVPFIRSVATS